MRDASLVAVSTKLEKQNLISKLGKLIALKKTLVVNSLYIYLRSNSSFLLRNWLNVNFVVCSGTFQKNVKLLLMNKS